MKIVVISADYPGPDVIYGDVFVQARVKELKSQFDVQVIGFNEGLSKNREHVLDDVQVIITGNLQFFYRLIREAPVDLFVIHLIRHHYMDFLLALNKPIAVFVHGYEALKWRHRLMNYNSIGALPYLIHYIHSNNNQLKKLRAFIYEGNQRNNVSFVFVSRWLQDAVEKNLGVHVRNRQVIPNGIDTKLFNFEKKNPDLRKHVLLLRSFNGRNYANDLAVNAILKLSKTSIFTDLHFSIYGEGYLFKKLTDPLKDFSNVKIFNQFVSNNLIPAIHKTHGIFLCPSRLDTQGVSMCEAMASGLVPIASPIGGIREYAKHGVDSFLENDASGIAAAIQKLYSDDKLFLSMSEKASETIRKNISIEKTVGDEAVLFVNLINSENQ